MTAAGPAQQGCRIEFSDAARHGALEAAYRHALIPSPFVIDNPEHLLAGSLCALLVQSADEPPDIATASFALSGV
jgi:hypothetical protein